MKLSSESQEELIIKRNPGSNSDTMTVYSCQIDNINVQLKMKSSIKQEEKKNQRSELE